VGGARAPHGSEGRRAATKRDAGHRSRQLDFFSTAAAVEDVGLWEYAG
jgi:hypothetical protein